MSIILAVIIFSLIVLFHEWGHFLLAKRNHVTVTEFSLGMGPRVLSKDWHGTKYSLKLLPIGGSCLMVGEDESCDDPTAFVNQSVWARIAIVAAGPVFNFILAFLLALFIIGGVGYDAPVIYRVTDGFPAQAAGMEDGDTIVRLNSTPIHVYREVSLFVQMNQKNADQPVKVVYKHNGEKREVTLIPKKAENGHYYLGFTGSGIRTKGGIVDTVIYSAYEVKYWITTTIKSLGMMFSGEVKADDISGPVGIVSTIDETYRESKSDGAYYVWLNMLNIAILLSANLGVMNLLPIPALDGGRLVFLVLEVIRGKQIDPDAEGKIHLAGLAFLLLLMVFVMFNDFRRILL